MADYLDEKDVSQYEKILPLGVFLWDPKPKKTTPNSKYYLD